MAAQPSYSLTEVTPEATPSFGRDISKKGWMLVNGTFGELTEGAVCSPSLQCATVPSPVGSKSPYAHVDFISANGMLIVGTAPRNGGVSHAMIYNWSQSIDIGALTDPDCPKCKLDSWPIGVNRSGQVIGGTRLSDQVTERSFIWEAGVMTDIGALAGSVGTEALAINEHGHVVGGSRTPDNGSVPFIFRGGKMKAIELPAGATHGAAMDINDRSQILINAVMSGGANELFVYDHGTYTKAEVGERFQAAYAIRMNNLGFILGSYQDARSEHRHPFVFDGVDAFDLNDCLTGDSRNDYEVYDAFAFNDQGLIMATAIHKATHTQRAVLLKPMAN